MDIEAGGWDVCGRLVHSVFIANRCMNRRRTLNPADFCFLTFWRLIRVDGKFQCGRVFGLCQVQFYGSLYLLSPHLTDTC